VSDPEADPSRPISRERARRLRAHARRRRAAAWLVAFSVVGAAVATVMAASAAEPGRVSAASRRTEDSPGRSAPDGVRALSADALDRAPATTSTVPPLAAPPPADGAVPVAAPAVTVDQRVFFVGDSVMVAAAPKLPAAMAGWSVIADARVSRFLPEGIDVVRSRRGEIHDVVVVHLGNNYGGDERGFRRQVDQMMAELHGVRLVVWVTVAEDRPQQREVNDVLRAAVAAYPNAALLDWTPLWAAHRDYTGGDHLHLSARGTTALAGLMGSGTALLAFQRGLAPAPGALPPQFTLTGKIPAVPGAVPTPVIPSTTAAPPTTAAPSVPSSSAAPATSAPTTSAPPSTAAPTTTPTAAPTTTPGAPVPG
jgi:hypothetical protein